jgi:hypothetical protein
MAENRTAAAATQIASIGVQARAADRALSTGNYRTAVLDLDAAVLHSGEALTLTVKAWRGIGASWQEIGDALGITRQAAWQRFSHGAN